MANALGALEPGTVPGMEPDEFDALLEKIQQMGGQGGIKLSPSNDLALPKALGAQSAPLGIGSQGGAGLGASLAVARQTQPTPQSLAPWLEHSLTPVDHDPFAGPVKLPAGTKVTPVDHNPWAPAPAYHVGSPTQIGPIAKNGWSQDEYATEDGGSIEFVYDKNGLPNHAVKWSKSGDPLDDFKPGEVFFPPKQKPTMHAGSPTYVGSSLDSYKTSDGGTIDYHYASNGDPELAVAQPKTNEEGDVTAPSKFYQPEEVKFPEKQNPDDASPALGLGPKQTESTGILGSMLNRGAVSVPAQWQSAYDKLAKPEADAIGQYTGPNYYDINGFLSGRSKADEVDPLVGRWIQHMDSAFARPESVIPEDSVLHRGLSTSVWDKYQHLQPGDTWTNLPYMSTSYDREAAKSFSNGPLAKINVPKGTPGLYVAPISQNAHEHEVILPRGMQFRVMSIDPNTRQVELTPITPNEQQLSLGLGGY